MQELYDDRAGTDSHCSRSASFIIRQTDLLVAGAATTTVTVVAMTRMAVTVIVTAVTFVVAFFACAAIFMVLAIFAIGTVGTARAFAFTATHLPAAAFHFLITVVAGCIVVIACKCHYRKYHGNASH